jgi:hypothetical protein
MSLILFIILIVLLVGALPTWPYSSGWGYYPSGGLGLVVLDPAHFSADGASVISSGTKAEADECGHR